VSLTLSAEVAKVFLPFVLPVCAWVAFSDLKYMKIRNTAVLTLVLIYAIVGVIVMPMEAYLAGWLNGIVLLVVGFLASSLGMVGAGDAKVFSAIVLYVPRADTMRFTILLAACLLGGFIAHRIIRASPIAKKLAPDWESWHRVKEYPAGLSLGFVLVAYLTLAAFFNG
jgi:prepilin peptidase CpaA